MRDAIDLMHATNNFPEFTGTVCPAPCESACVLTINAEPVTIKQIELAIAERAWKEGWIVPRPPELRTGRRVVVVGSGPAGLAVAAELNQRGHAVTVFERDEAIGGLLRFGVPDAKLEKWIIDRRVDVLAQEGIDFRCDIHVGRDLTAAELRADFDAIVLAIGSRVPRDLPIAGRELEAVEWAMDYLYGRNRGVAAQEGRATRPDGREISAAGKAVVIVGGGDTGMDCLSNAHREGARSAVILDVYPELFASGGPATTPWPQAPRRTASTYALEEGGTRRWRTEVTGFSGRHGRLTHVHGRWVEAISSRDMRPVPGSEFDQPADLALIAISFRHPERTGLLEQLDTGLDARGNVAAALFASSQDGVFACGDARTGQSLVVTAIADGRRCARIVDRHLDATSGWATS